MAKKLPFAAFAVVRHGKGEIWATTRDGKDAGRVGLPGGKRDLGEHPEVTARRESAEEGLHLHGKGRLVHVALVDGQLVHWYEYMGCTPLRSYKEQARGIRAIIVPLAAISTSGYGNDFLALPE